VPAVPVTLLHGPEQFDGGIWQLVHVLLSTNAFASTCNEGVVLPMHQHWWVRTDWRYLLA
jgi:hypothetical protein